MASAAATPHGIQLTWQDSDAGVTFNVFRGTASGAEDHANPIASGLTTPTFLDTNGLAGTTYFYLVEAVLNGVNSLDSNEASAMFPTIPAAPTNLTAVAV